MSVADRMMGWSLRWLGRLAGSQRIDRMHLRSPAERAVHHGVRAGFQVAGVASRSFKAVQKLTAPARLRSRSGRELFDPSPDQDQTMLADAAREFAIEQLRPSAQAADGECAAPADLLEGSVELGIAAMGVPEALGGVGNERSAVTNVLIAEAMAQGDLGLAVACLAPAAVSTGLVLWGDEYQQSAYLPAFVGEQPPAAALAVMEAGALFDPFRLTTRARKVDDGYVLEGAKALVPRVAQAELLIVAAELEGSGPALFIVESSSAGLRVAPTPAMGLRAAATGTLVLDQVKLPRTALLGGADAGVYSECVHLARLGWCALAVGAAQAALDYVGNYVNERSAFGEPISQRQSVAFMVSDIVIELEGMRLLTRRAASRAEQGLPFAREAALARRLCANKGAKIGADAIQLLGGHGFVKDHPVERWYRDLRAVGIMEGALLV